MDGHCGERWQKHLCRVRSHNSASPPLALCCVESKAGGRGLGWKHKCRGLPRRHPASHVRNPASNGTQSPPTEQGRTLPELGTNGSLGIGVMAATEGRRTCRRPHAYDERGLIIPHLRIHTCVPAAQHSCVLGLGQAATSNSASGPPQAVNTPPFDSGHEEGRQTRTPQKLNIHTYMTLWNSAL